MCERILQHKPLLADRVRMEAYKKAIHEVVRKDDLVVDIGTGSGILSFLALQAGAKRIYAVEVGKIIEEAESLAKINGFEEKIVFIKGRSDRIKLPEKVDVIISEIIGNFGLEENLHQFIIDARKRFLKPEGKLIPSWLELYLVPVESESYWKENVDFWGKDYYGIDYSPVRNRATSQKYVIDCSDKVNWLSEPAMLSHLNFYSLEKAPLVFEGKSVINKKGTLHGLLGFHQTGLSQGIVISTSPKNPPTYWKHNFFPLKDAVKVEKGDEACCKMIALPHGAVIFWQWETSVYRNNNEIAKFSQSNIHIRKEEFLIRQKGFKPILSEKAKIQKKVLEICDGNKTMQEIAEILLAEYPQKFSDIKDAFEFVVGIIHSNAKIE
jgi:SAM-dependent methyltransferase